MSSARKVVVIGTGYVGLVSGVCFSDMGHQVTCIDTNQEKIDGLKEGKMPIFERGLEDLVSKSVNVGRLEFDIDMRDHINKADAVVIAVGTPIKEDGSANLDFVYRVVDEIIQNLSKDITIIIKSTIPPGTCDFIQKKFDESISQYKSSVVSNPEFLREGEAIEDFMNPDRVVIGCDSDKKEEMKNFYQDHISRNISVIFTNRITAELIKYSSNSFLAMKIAFINEIASISEKIGADMDGVRLGIGSDSRIGKKFLNPGPGFGGSCFPKDIEALVELSDKINADSKVIRSVNNSNKDRIQEIANNILAMTEPKDNICFLGMTYKANTDDVRTSPSIDIIRILLVNNRTNIKCYDPMGIESARKILSDKVTYHNNIYDAAEDASLVVIATEWDEFKDIQPEKLSNLMKSKSIYDLRRIVNMKQFIEADFKTKVIGLQDA